MGLIEDSLLERNFNNSLHKLVVAASVFLQRWGWFSAPIAFYRYLNLFLNN